MNDGEIQGILLRVIGNIPSSLASVEERALDGDGPLVAMIHNEPWNVGVQRSIVRLLDAMVRRGAIRFVGVDGAHGYIRTEALRAAPIDAVRTQAADRFLESMAISGAEYCHARPFASGMILCGLEDAALYERAGKLWREMGPLQHDHTTGMFKSPSRKMQRFIDLEFDRAEAMLANLQRRLQEHGLCTAAVIATGNLPEILSGSLTSAAFRWVMIRPSSSTRDDLDKYLELSGETPGARGYLHELIAAVDRETGHDPIEWPADGDWARLRTQQAREMETTGGEPLKKDLRRLFGSQAFRDMAHDKKTAVLDEVGLAAFVWIDEVMPGDVLQALGKDEVQKRRATALLSLLDPDGEEFAQIARGMPDEHAAFVLASKQLDDARRECVVAARRAAAAQRAVAASKLSDPGATQQDIANALELLAPDEALAAAMQPGSSSEAQQTVMREIVAPSLIRGMGAEARRRARRRPRGFTLLGGVFGIVAGLLDWTAIAWLRWSILAVLLLGVIDCVHRRNWRATAAASVVMFASAAGWYWWGRWGVVGGLVGAWLFNRLVVRVHVYAAQDQQLETMAMELARAQTTGQNGNTGR